MGGSMQLDDVAAREAVGTIAGPLGLSIEAAAQGIVDVANEHMARALRVMSVQRGLDPADFTLASFGGAGGLHVCALADSLDMKKALVPVHAGVLSAMGMLVAPRARHLSQTLNRLLTDVTDADVSVEIEILAQQGRQALLSEGFAENQMAILPSVDLRYLGQSYAINVSWSHVKDVAEAFQRKHETLYGHRLQLAIELVSLRVKVQGPNPEFSIKGLAESVAVSSGRGPIAQQVSLADIPEPVTVYAREALRTGDSIQGPALITEIVSTTYLAPGWQCQTDSYGNLLMTRDLPQWGKPLDIK
jgi:N-methylhydantoinase A